MAAKPKKQRLSSVLCLQQAPCPWGAWDTKPGHSQGQGKPTAPVLSPRCPCDEPAPRHRLSVGHVHESGQCVPPRSESGPRASLRGGHPLHGGCTPGCTLGYTPGCTPGCTLGCCTPGCVRGCAPGLALACSTVRPSRAKRSGTPAWPRHVSHLFTSRSHGPACSFTFPSHHLPLHFFIC